jgi:RluA family pseudouridine synthase
MHSDLLESGTIISAKSSNIVNFSPDQTTSRKVRIVQPYPITHHFKPNTEFVGKTLLEKMATKFPFKPIEVWEERIKSGRVYLQNRSCEPSTLLELNDEIRHHNPAVIEPSVPDEVRIVKEDNDYLAVYKPSPMPMHPGGRYNKNSLTSILEEMGFAELRITHRLDSVTSGLVLFAKNKPFSKLVMEAFTSGKVEKEYHAIVSGIPDENSRTIQSKIRRKRGFVFESGPDLDSGQDGITEFEMVESYDDASLIKCRPITGRTHQIRLHLAEWGFPIIDDPIYGPNGDTSSKRTQNVGISLESKSLKIPSLGVNVKC